MEFAQQLYNAMAGASIYLSVALGLTLAFGLTGILNFAHGQLISIGAFTAYGLVTSGASFGVAVAAATVIAGAVGGLLYLGFFERTLSQPLNGFVVSLGLILALRSAIILIWDRDQHRVDPPFDGVWTVGDVRIDQPRLLLIGTTVVSVVALFVLLNRAKTGRGIRAVSQNRTAALLLGVPIRRLTVLAFVIGSAMAGLTGGVLAGTFPFSADSGFDLVIKGFAVAIIGGLGSVQGAVVAALILGVAETIGAAYFSLEWAPAYGLIAVAVIIVFRPAGLMSSGASRSRAEGGHFSLGVLAARTHAREVTLQAMSSVASRRLDRGVNLGVVFMTAIALLCVPAMNVSSRTLSVATNMLVVMIAAYAFWFALGRGGLFSMAPAAMMSVGAYTAAIADSRWGFAFWWQLPLAIVVSALVSVVLGAIALRASAAYFVVLTLVLSQLVFYVTLNWRDWTGGNFGLSSSGAPDAIGPLAFDTPEALYYLVFAILAIVIAVLGVLSRVEFGARLTAVRENETLAQSLGVDPYLNKLMLFTVFGTLSGLAGVLYFNYVGYVAPQSFSINLTMTIILIVVFGGVSTWMGPAVGAFAVAFLPEVLTFDPVQRDLANGLVLVLVIVALPMGVAGAVKQLFVARRWSRADIPDHLVAERGSSGRPTAGVISAEVR